MANPPSSKPTVKPPSESAPKPLPIYYAAARRSFAGEIAAAGHDFAESFRNWSLWSTLALNDIAARYRGSILGPFWITISNFAFVLGIGLLYSQLMHTPTEVLIPWIATSVTIWNLISATTVESGDSFLQGSSIIRQSSLPLPIFVWRAVMRNLINFAHQIVVIFAVALWYKYLLKIDLPMAVLGLALVLFNLSWISFLAAVVAARYRDVQQVITTVLQLVFFLSPIIWIPRDLKGLRSTLLEVNPINHMLVVTRNPLLGQPSSLHSMIILLVLGAVGWAITYILYAAVRRRIVHYL